MHVASCDWSDANWYTHLAPVVEWDSVRLTGILCGLVYLCLVMYTLVEQNGNDSSLCYHNVSRNVEWKT